VSNKTTLNLHPPPLPRQEFFSHFFASVFGDASC
jgi:hypothetical protein